MNGALFNRRLFAGIAPAVLVISASAGFSATATVTPAETSVLQKARMDLLGAASAAWDASFLPGGFVAWNASATTLIKPYVNRAGVGNWVSSPTFGAVTTTEVFSSVDFDTFTSFTAVPFNKFGSVPFTGTATFDGDGERIHGPLGNWPLSATWDLQEGLVDREAAADWTGTTPYLQFESTQYVALDDTTYHLGYGMWQGNATFSENPLLTALFVGDAVWQEATQLEVIPTLIHGARGNFICENDLYIYANRTVNAPTSVWPVAGATFTGIGSELFLGKSDGWENFTFINIAGTVIQAARATFAPPNIDLTMSAWAEFRGKATFAPFTDLVSIGEHKHLPQMTWFANTTGFFVDPNKVRISYVREATADWAVNNTFDQDDVLVRFSRFQTGDGDWAANAQVAGDGDVFIPAFGNWTGAVTSLAIAGTLSSFNPDGDFLFAPDIRTLTVPADNRGLRVSADDRVFYVTVRSVSFEV